MLLVLQLRTSALSDWKWWLLLTSSSLPPVTLHLYHTSPNDAPTP